MTVGGPPVSTGWLVQPLGLVLATRPDMARALTARHPEAGGCCPRCGRPFPCWSARVGTAALVVLNEAVALE